MSPPAVINLSVVSDYISQVRPFLFLHLHGGTRTHLFPCVHQGSPRVSSHSLTGLSQPRQQEIWLSQQSEGQ